MAFDAYDSPSPPPRNLPVSSRLRNQTSPPDPRYEELKRFAAEKTRFTTSRLRSAPNKRLNYSELTDDEDGEEQANYPHQSHKQSSQARVAESAEDRQLGHGRIARGTHKPNGSSVATSAKKQIKLRFGGSVTKSGLHGNKTVKNSSSREVIIISDDSDNEQPVTVRSGAALSNTILIDSTGGILFKNLATEVRAVNQHTSSLAFAAISLVSCHWVVSQLLACPLTMLTSAPRFSNILLVTSLPTETFTDIAILAGALSFPSQLASGASASSRNMTPAIFQTPTMWHRNISGDSSLCVLQQYSMCECMAATWETKSELASQNAKKTC